MVKSADSDKNLGLPIVEGEKKLSPREIKREQKREKRRDLRKQKKTLSPENRPNVLFVVCDDLNTHISTCLLYTSPSPRDRTRSRMPSSA